MLFTNWLLELWFKKGIAIKVPCDQAIRQYNPRTRGIILVNTVYCDGDHNTMMGKLVLRDYLTRRVSPKGLTRRTDNSRELRLSLELSY